MGFAARKNEMRLSYYAMIGMSSNYCQAEQPERVVDDLSRWPEEGAHHKSPCRIENEQNKFSPDLYRGPLSTEPRSECWQINILFSATKLRPKGKEAKVDFVRNMVTDNA